MGHWRCRNQFRTIVLLSQYRLYAGSEQQGHAGEEREVEENDPEKQYLGRPEAGAGPLDGKSVTDRL